LTNAMKESISTSSGFHYSAKLQVMMGASEKIGFSKWSHNNQHNDTQHADTSHKTLSITENKTKTHPIDA